MKIKIAFYSHSIDYAGTWRSHERILLNLNQDIFQPYVLYNQSIENNRLDFIIEKLGCEFVIPFLASTEKTGPDMGYTFINTNFFWIFLFNKLCKSIVLVWLRFRVPSFFKNFTNRITSDCIRF